MHEFLGSLYNANDFIVGNDDDLPKVLSTSTLIAKLEEWVTQVQNGDVEPHLTYGHIAECLCLTFATLWAARPYLNPEIKLSLVSLGQTLGYAASKAFSIAWEDNPQYNKFPSTWGLLIDKTCWTARLRASGWCVSQVKIILDTSNSLHTLHFLACCNGTEVKERRERCDELQCIEYQNDLDRYETQHRSKDCKCKELIVDHEAIIAILKKGLLPLIHINEHDILADLSVNIVASQPTDAYVSDQVVARTMFSHAHSTLDICLSCHCMSCFPES